MRFLVAPMKVGHDTEASLRFLKSKRWRFASLTEMDLGNRTYLFAVRHVFGALLRIFSKDLGQHSQEIPILYRISPLTRIVDFELFKLSADVPGVGMGNDRWCGRLRFKYRRRLYALYVTHLNAGVQRRPPEGDGSIVHGPRWSAFKQETARLERLMERDIANPDIAGVIFQGDVNMMPVGEGLSDPGSVYTMLDRLGMKFTNSRVVVTAWWGMTHRRTQVFPPGRNGWGSDHACQIVTLVRDPHARRPKAG